MSISKFTRELTLPCRKPRNARSKRALEKRAPKVVENPKTVLFLRGTTCSQITQDALADLTQLRQPFAQKFTKKNAIHPFDDATSLEFFSEKNDASFLVFGSSSKKRPHCVTFVRTFNYKVLDMLELYLNAESFRQLDQFRGKKPVVGLRPMVLFAGTAFESTVANEYTTAKSMLTDFFCADRASDMIDVEGLQYIISVVAEEEGPVAGSKPAIHVRAYLIRTKRSGQRLPRVEVSFAPSQMTLVHVGHVIMLIVKIQVEEMGPRMDFRIGRMREPEEAMMKEALKRPKNSEEKTRKNISMDIMGDKMGRIHVGKQDWANLQTRKMRALKRSRGNDGEENEGRDESAQEPKKKRKHSESP